MRIIPTSGRVIDPASQTDTIADVVIEDSVFTAIVAPGSSESSSAPAPDDHCIDVSGQLVIPGLIDPHAQVFPGVGDLCVGIRGHAFLVASHTLTYHSSHTTQNW